MYVCMSLVHHFRPPTSSSGLSSPSQICIISNQPYKKYERDILFNEHLCRPAWSVLATTFFKIKKKLVGEPAPLDHTALTTRHGKAFLQHILIPKCLVLYFEAGLSMQVVINCSCPHVQIHQIDIVLVLNDVV